MSTANQPAALCDPPALLAIMRAARQAGDRELERSARQLLRDQYGIEIVIRRTQEDGPRE